MDSPPIPPEQGILNTPIHPQSLEGIGKATVTLQIEIVPANAAWGVTWESDNPAVYYDNSRFQIVGTAPVEIATILFTSLGKTADGGHAVKEVYVRSRVMAAEHLIRWNYTEIPSGASADWHDSGSKQHTSSAALPDREGKGYFLTLPGTVNNEIDTANKRLRTAGSSHYNFGYIDGVQGPYRILLPFDPGGSGGSRYATIQVGSGAQINAGGSIVNTGTAGRKTLDHTYTGTDIQRITLGQSGGLYISEIIIELQHE